jgi:hypothetical protein
MEGKLIKGLVASINDGRWMINVMIPQFWNKER